ncbi:DUF2790 domain-containing protein [Pseudomonas sp. BCA14]|uniref:DUF2790 domain-containing protein n=1 Tax=unclassified Pseudomonas TaxID=196821 RepID=UPI00106E54D9|nr:MULTISPECIES: DUF2790 domain-containing protein [unclassified Pseudomonas]TFF04869.1 DUF2790 domain-containing protein [Pseudomonas sp. JMN1]TFF06347.1 DUF2790 domain-containing protein [Pseudomonas sp. BCA17]TFF22336.1 DUF2790 domain-containing protein [Pseudomonas sp. BCA14]TFF26733.1 DUF2790 domain-containing protein [Pseudomonas sp. BCA13]
MNPNNWKAFLAASLFAVTFTAHADVAHKPDIQRVLSTSETTLPGCGVVNARMTYLDSKGETRVLDYMKFTDHCGDGN